MDALSYHKLTLDLLTPISWYSYQPYSSDSLSPLSTLYPSSSSHILPYSTSSIPPLSISFPSFYGTSNNMSQYQIYNSIQTICISLILSHIDTIYMILLFSIVFHYSLLLTIIFSSNSHIHYIYLLFSSLYQLSSLNTVFYLHLIISYSL